MPTGYGRNQMHKALTRDIRAAMDLPTHPTMTDPRTGSALVALGFRRNGDPIWPVMGGDGTGDGGDGGTGEGQPKTFDQAAVDKIVADRLARERAKYVDYDALKEKAAAHEALLAATATDTEKAIAAAKAEAAAAAKAEVLGQVGGQLVEAHIRAAVGTRLPEAQLAALLGHLDRSKFLTADHQVDAAAVTAYVDSVAPAKPAGAPNLQQGTRGSTNTGGATTVAAGRDLWAERHPRKATS
jgi:hypothetical protein